MTDAEPGLAPPEPPGVTVAELVVQGERWRVSRSAEHPGQRDFSWLSHPHGYGFALSGEPGWEPTPDELATTIRDFLAEVDPATGYLPD